MSLEKQDSSEKEIILEVREIFLRTLPNCNKQFGRGVMVYVGSVANTHFSPMGDREI
jgi:hypothetical protein